jgi:isopenicillin N synthase-like dioxygenase
VTTELPKVDLRNLRSGGRARDEATSTLGGALEELGFFALVGHDLTSSIVESAYAEARAFFALPTDVKLRYEDRARGGQRGYTSFGREHAKDSPTPDLKEFWQVGRTDVPADHPVHARYGPNVWPDADVPRFAPAMTALYEALERMGRELLVACARYLGEPDDCFSRAADGGDTILRVIHYPALLEAPPRGAVRAAAHEDINFLTLLLGATAEGLELKDRAGSYHAIRAGHDEILVDSGDMLQNLTNGVFRSTTHRVVVPEGDAAKQARFSMPCFMHPRADVDLTPLARCVARTGGAVRYPSTTAGDYLARRLAEIGLG